MSSKNKSIKRGKESFLTLRLSQYEIELLEKISSKTGVSRAHIARGILRLSGLSTLASSPGEANELRLIVLEGA